MLAKSNSCYNAFSHLDMRVEVKIPGGVESYCIDERGDKRVASEGLWLETFLCAVLRAYSYADDGSGDSIKKIIGVRRFDPITSTEVEHKFLDAAERLFFKGMCYFGCSVCVELTLAQDHSSARSLKFRFQTLFLIISPLASSITYIRPADMLRESIFLKNYGHGMLRFRPYWRVS